jgi:autotransporter family porin
LARSDRTFLFTGTALASTLMLASILGPAPAHAVTETIDRERIVTNTDTATNNTKIDTTLFAGVLNLLVAEGLADVIGLVNGVVIGGSYIQVGNIFLNTEINNEVTVINNGDIDPYIGMQGSINNDGVGIANVSAIGIATGANILGNLTQEANHVLTASLINLVDVHNNGSVEAEYLGMFGEITNEAVGIGNLSASGIATGADIVGTVTQSANSNLSNGLINVVEVVNSGDVDAGIGLAGGIFNDDVALGNANATGILHGFDLLGDLIQAANDTQVNAVANIVAIENGGDATGTYAGIVAVTFNDANLLSAMGNNTTAAITSIIDIDDDLTQSATATQVNEMANATLILNNGDAEGGEVAILATVLNDGWELGNTSNAAMATAFSVGGEHTQSLVSDQFSAVESNILIDNRGRADGGDVGIAAAIANTDLVLSNVATGLLESSGGTPATQTVTVDQINMVTNNIAVTNSGQVRGGEIGVLAEIENEGIAFDNIVDIEGINPDAGSSQTVNVNQRNIIQNTIVLTNSGSIEGGEIGVAAGIFDPTFAEVNFTALNLDSPVQDVNVTEGNEVENRIDIFNTGTITADSLLAIDTFGARTTIVNEGGGIITGFVDLTEFNDRFINRAGGVFEAREESDFGDGFDRFINAGGGTVHAIGNTSFVNLDEFTNRGVISMVNGRTNDVFEISNTVGDTDLDYRAESGSTLAVDAFLGGPGSKADNFIINGDVSGKTLLRVNNTNPGPGVLNREGIPVVFANAKVKSNAFFLDKPIDAGLFDYDLHFVRTNSGFFELRSHAGGGSHTLPRFATAAQDIFFLGNDTWFDRSADLRVLLNGGAPGGAPPDAQYLNGAQPVPGITPAVWVKGSGTWLKQDDKARTESSGRVYNYDLNRDLDVAHFQTGVDFGAFDVLSPGDMLIYGILGGAILGDLDYNQIARQFDISGGEVGTYATYLRGGLFVDTLLKADFVEFDPNGALGVPGSFNSTSWGVRTDAGYRFGSFRRGLFLEPLATIAFNWVDVEDFTIGGNKVVLHDESVVRGRLGLRLGTSTEVWTGTLMEPFVIGSVWGNLGSDSNRATLTSNGTTFHFQDDLDETWGVVSAGVNFFNFAANTTVFGKLDVIFGDETDGISGKGGLRVSW